MLFSWAIEISTSSVAEVLWLFNIAEIFNNFFLRYIYDIPDKDRNFGGPRIRINSQK